MAIVLVVCLAVVIRCPRLGERPMHCDEAVHAVKFGSLLEEGEYRYDPTEYHGPTLYYFTLPLARLRNVHRAAELSEALLRTVPVLFGSALVLATFLLVGALGRGGALTAAVLTGVSPAMVYYSRYYIQETLLVFFTFTMLIALWRYAQRPRAGWALAAGASAGLMFATKETCILNWAAMATAGLVNWSRLRRGWQTVSARHLALAVAAALGVAAIFFTSFFSHPRGLLDAFAAYARYVDRAGGEGHEKPWFYYLTLLSWDRRDGFVWSEGAILVLAVVGIIALISQARRLRPTFPALVAAYTLILMLIYLVIPYKTPWLVLGFLHGLILLAGFGANVFWRIAASRAWRVVLGLLLLAGVTHLGFEARRAAFRFAADERNPWAYSHTSADALRLVRNIREAAAFDPAGKALVIKIISPEYWPLPWYLREFPNVGYWHDMPDDPQAPIVITTPALAEKVEPRLKGDYARDFAGLRPGFILTAYIRQDLWDAMVAGRSRATRSRAGHE